jgi:hypothetical protein
MEANTSGKSLMKAFVLSLIFLACLFSGLFLTASKASEEESEGYSSVLIQGKYIDAILAYKDMRYTVTRLTKIFDSSGNAMTIVDLPVPCRAKIYSQPQVHNDQIATKIIITEIMPGATTGWYVPMPE